MEHSFNILLAKEYGIEEAILINNMYFWISKNEANEKHFHDGRYWTYNTNKALSELFPYISESKMFRVLKNLEEKGILLKGNYNKSKMDRTCWYSFTDSGIKELNKYGYKFQKCEMQISEMKNGDSQNEMTIPYNNTDINNIKEDTKKVSEKDIVDFWNKQTSDFPKVRKISDDIKGSIKKLLARKYTYEDMKKAILLCNSLDDFYKGRKKDSNWKATLQWLLANTNKNFDKILNGALHTSDTQQKMYENIMSSDTSGIVSNYNPKLDGRNMLWLESEKCYMTTFDLSMLNDGYTSENRPASAIIMYNGWRYQWNVESKKWERI